MDDYESDVPDDVDVYRLIPTQQCEVVDGEWEFASWAFDNSSLPGHQEEMSVILGDRLAELNRRPEDLPVYTYPEEADRWGVAAMSAGCVRGISGQQIVRSPTSREPAHGDVIGVKNHKRRKRLKACARWVVRPAAPVS